LRNSPLIKLALLVLVKELLKLVLWWP